MLTLVLRGNPVSKKNTWAVAGGRKGWPVRVYQRNKGLKGYVEGVRIQAAYQMRQQGVGKIAKPERVAMRVRVFFGHNQGRMDVHNACETVLDALEGVCYDNDNQVVGLFHPPERLRDEENPRIEIELMTATEAKQDPRWQ